MSFRFFFLFVALASLLLSGCSHKESVPEQQGAINLDGQVQSCYVHKDYYACTLASGRTYYVTKGYAEEIMFTKTKWDKTVWPAETIIINATREDQENVLNSSMD